MEIVQDGHNKKLRLDMLGAIALNAYQIAVKNGFVGTEQEWLESLIGPKGDDGNPGDSAYELAQQEGYEGTLEDWLLSLKGPKGDKGDPGSGGGSESVELTISEPSLTWTLNHNLGSQPQITLLSVGGKEMSLAEIVRTSANQALVYFDIPTAGKAICSS